MGSLYTIGHSLHRMDYFLGIIKDYNINYILDVRSTPYSKYAEQFNRGYIEKELQNAGLNYFFMGSFFGARPDDRSLYCDEGYLDFERVRKSPQFLKGFNSVIKGLEQENNIVLMCTEKDPFDCHRAIMVSRAFDLANIEVNHILEDGKLQSQTKLNERLLNKYYPDRTQLTLFDYLDIKEESDYLSMAYQQRNKEIGYRFEAKKMLMA